MLRGRTCHADRATPVRPVGAVPVRVLRVRKVLLVVVVPLMSYISSGSRIGIGWSLTAGDGHGKQVWAPRPAGVSAYVHR